MTVLTAMGMLGLTLVAGSRDGTLEQRIGERAAPLVEGGGCVGLVVGVIDGDRSCVVGLGVVEEGGETPDGSTIFEIGSISKVFTGLLLADMADRGMVAPEEPVADLLPEGVEVPGAEGRPITLLDLSTHTSGLPRLPSNFTPADPSNPYADYDAGDLYAFLSGHQLRRPPGAEHEYSNLGAGLLGHALSVRAKSSFEDLLRDRIAAPLGMTDTAIHLDEAHRERFAEGHDAGGRPVPHWDLAALAGAGGIRSTADDMLRFLRAELEPGGTPLEAAIRASQEIRTGPEIRPRMALGWLAVGDGPALWHNGGTGGFASFAAIDPERRVAVIVLANSADRAVDRLGMDLLKAVGPGSEAPPDR